MSDWNECSACGMLCEAGEYHPYAACLMFRGCLNGDTVRANLEFVRRAPEPAGREECQHEWQPDSDVMNAVYCPKCDVTRTLPRSTREALDEAIADDLVGIAHLIRRHPGGYPRIVMDADKIEQAANLLRRLSRREW